MATTEALKPGQYTEVEWHPARRLSPYRPRCKRAIERQQERLFDQEGEASVG